MQVLRRVLSKIDQTPRQHKPGRGRSLYILPSKDNGELVQQQVSALKQALEQQAMTNTLRAADSLYLEQQLTDKVCFNSPATCCIVALLYFRRRFLTREGPYFSTWCAGYTL